MNAFWDFYWPLLTAAVIVGVLAGWIGFRAIRARQPKTPEFRRHAMMAVAAGAIVVLAFGALWTLGGVDAAVIVFAATLAVAILVAAAVVVRREVAPVAA